MQQALNLAIVGAGPVGLALALLAAERLPTARISLFDARAADALPMGDARSLALSQGSVQLLERLGAWPAAQAQPILQVHVSQVPPSWREAPVLIDAAEQGQAQLGAVLGYGPLVDALQQRWFAAECGGGARLASCFGQRVQALKPLPEAVELDAGVAQRFDLVVLAEGGLFDEQQAGDLRRDYHQRAWVGPVTLAEPHRGVAYERFTRSGPLALLPLRPEPGQPHRAALVWCVATDEDPVEALDEGARLALLASLLPADAPRLSSLGPLARFALGLNAQRKPAQGRVVRIGNAAQTMHPVAGQGLNLGLRDAFALVEQLQRAEAVPTALGGLERARRLDRWSLLATTDLLARGFTWQAPGLAALRGMALGALGEFGPLRRALARQLMFGWR